MVIALNIDTLVWYCRYGAVIVQRQEWCASVSLEKVDCLLIFLVTLLEINEVS